MHVIDNYLRIGHVFCINGCTISWKSLNTQHSFWRNKLNTSFVFDGINAYMSLLTDTAMLISEVTRFDSFYIFSTELLVFIVCRQTDKVFRLLWPSFVRVKIYYKYQLSINRKYRLLKSWIFHSEVVRALASRPGVMSSSPGLYLFSLSRIFFFISLFFFFFSQFRSKTLWEFILKVRQYRICNGKEAKLFYFFKVANTPRNGTIRHIAWLHLSSFLFKIQCFYRDANNLDPDDQH